MSDLEILKKKVTKLITKTDSIGYKFSDLDISAISSIGRAEKDLDLNWLAIQHFERLYSRIISKIT